MTPAMNVPWPPGSCAALPSFTKLTRALTFLRPRSGWSAMPVSSTATVTPLPVVRDQAYGARIARRPTAALEVVGCGPSSSKPGVPPGRSPVATIAMSGAAAITLGSVASAASAALERRAMTMSAALAVSTSVAPRRASLWDRAPARPADVWTRATSPTLREGSMCRVRVEARAVQAVSNDGATMTMARATATSFRTPHTRVICWVCCAPCGSFEHPPRGGSRVWLETRAIRRHQFGADDVSQAESVI